jgi:hypothetical protein
MGWWLFGPGTKGGKGSSCINSLLRLRLYEKGYRRYLAAVIAGGLFHLESYQCSGRKGECIILDGCCKTLRAGVRHLQCIPDALSTT